MRHTHETTTKSTSPLTAPAPRRPLTTIAEHDHRDSDPGLVVSVRGRSRVVTALTAVLVLYLLGQLVLPAVGTGLRSLLDALASASPRAPSTQPAARLRCARPDCAPRRQSPDRCPEPSFDFGPEAP